VPCTLIFGAYGAAIATVIANVPAWLVTLDRIGNAMGGGARIALPWRFYLRGLAVTGGIGLVLWLVRPHIHMGTAGRLVVMSAAYAVVYVIVGRIAGVLHSEDIATLRRWFTLGLWK
jgi:hypothetical protein